MTTPHVCLIITIEGDKVKIDNIYNFTCKSDLSRAFMYISTMNDVVRVVVVVVGGGNDWEGESLEDG